MEASGVHAGACLPQALPASASPKKRSWGSDALAGESVPDVTPSPLKTCRRSPRTPDIAHPPRLRPRKLGFDDVPDNSTIQELQEKAEQGQLSPGAAQKGTEKTPKKLPLPKKKELNARTSNLSNKNGIRTLNPVKTPRKTFLDYVVVDRIKFQTGDDVYIRRTEEDVDEEAEGCLVCGKSGKLVECDNCSRGVHLKCTDPPLKKVPKGEWLCSLCVAVAKSQSGKSRVNVPNDTLKTARELLLASKLWAARIERIWREADGMLWFQGRWYVIPEETAVGRQPHNLRRELFRTNHLDNNEVASILRKCNVMGPTEFRNSGRDGDDVFLCEYAYDPQFETFKRISDDDENGQASSDEPEDSQTEIEEDHESDSDSHDDNKRSSQKLLGSSKKSSPPTRAANVRGGHLSKVGAKVIPATARRKPATAFERAKAALRLTATPESLPCREREMGEISAFVTDAVVAGNGTLGHCLYISGVPGTGKTATVMEVMQKLKKSYEEKNLQPYRFVEINGLRLTYPEHLYTVLHEALTGHHVGWKKALQLLDERFSNPKPSRRVDARPCILFIDELDLLVTRNQSVLYNVFDWPTRPHSWLFVIGIANTIDLPERLLPRIASRMGLQRVSFSPYSHEQLQRIISTRLEAIDAFESQAVEFASRKVAAVSGDARRALELCRRAVEIAEARCANDPKPGSGKSKGCRVKAKSNDKGNLAGMKDVEEAIKEMFQAPHIKIMGRCTKLAKIFLVSMVYEQHKSGMMETTFEKVAAIFTYLCQNNNESPVDWDTLLSIGCSLGACRLILCEAGCRHRIQKLQLNFPTDDVSFALKEDPEVPWIGKYL
ncbi:hypothetical protein GOP47_0019606 [Adiantum capillus-veneris]|uniref:Origin recognition complex subunit 1 n=1 Tax=Adiantum capillus-veneris TaxID=13818 RepID=A0A9D4UBE0_ADICA|nr:hypothetical protein GOP47_0019606 [Adiantum capillus-veneris]